jgi:DNA polymerase I-like protein with 3'-5' exonuclease and polymerase domains
MNLLPGWPELIEGARRAQAGAAARALLPTRMDVPRAAAEIVRVTDGVSASALLEVLRSVTVSAIAIDSEYAFDRSAVPLRSDREWNDIRSQRPICVSLAAWVATDGGSGDGCILRAVLDVRRPGIAAVLGESLRLRVPFVFHHAKVELFTLWSLGLEPDLYQLYDTYIVAACLNLGRLHKRAHRGERGGEAEQIRSEEELTRRKAHGLSLVGQCEQYGLGYPHSDSKDELRQNFLRLGPDGPLTERLVEYAAADAEWTLRLYVAQQADILRQGLHAHLHTIEFPFTIANARMEWRGVHVDPARRDLVRRAASGAANYYAGELKKHGIDPPGSRPKFLDAMKVAGLLAHFQRGGEFSTEDRLLETVEALHPAIRALRMHRRYGRLANEEWLTGALMGADGRVHPVHHQLGAATGRNSCTTPNIAGIGRALRPVVTAPAGRGIVELDYSQIEVGVAAAEYDDPDLIAAFNSGDVYAAMALRFFAEKLSAEERGLAPREFKKRRPGLRDRMKTFVLAVIYNIQAPALAARFSIGAAEAERERERFLDLFPPLKRRLEESVAFGAVRGYATVVSGLRRHVEQYGKPSTWTRNFLRNTPIQGSAAVVFKHAVVLLDREFRGTDTWLVLPVHDSIVIECAIGGLDDVAERAAQIMRSALHAYYPKLRARVDVNKAGPTCWNKDGHVDSLDRFLEDPTYRLEDLARESLGREWAEGVQVEDRDHQGLRFLEAEIEEIAARRGIQVDAGSWCEACEERAARMEFDAGFSRDAAESKALEATMTAVREQLEAACGASGSAHA